MCNDNTSPAATFSRKGTTHDDNMSEDGFGDSDTDSSGAAVPEDHARADSDDGDLEAEKEAFKESRPDPKDAKNVPDHECDHPDAPWA